MSSPAPNDSPRLPAPGRGRKEMQLVSIRRRALIREIVLRIFSDILLSIPDSPSPEGTVLRPRPEQCRKHFRTTAVKAFFVHSAMEKPHPGS
jgi:hypothetical protein